MTPTYPPWIIAAATEIARTVCGDVSQWGVIAAVILGEWKEGRERRMILDVTRWHVRCDHCKTDSSSSEAGADAIERWQLRRGWLRRRIHYTGIIAHLCPTCAKSPPEWWPEEDRTV